MSAKGPQAKHGTLKRYRKWKCRCDKCRAKEAEQRKMMRDRAKARAA